MERERNAEKIREKERNIKYKQIFSKTRMNYTHAYFRTCTAIIEHTHITTSYVTVFKWTHFVENLSKD